jgi:hypothetical protein
VADERSLTRDLTAHAQTGVAARLIVAGRRSLTSLEPVVETIYRTGLEPGGLAGAGSRVPKLQKLLLARSAALTGVLGEISHAEAARAARARMLTKLGATGAMLLLLVAFVYFYLRSAAAQDVVERLAREDESLLGESWIEARTDPLTELGNRRALVRDLASAITQPSASSELLLAMFDLERLQAIQRLLRPRRRRRAAAAPWRTARRRRLANRLRLPDGRR